MVVKKKTLCRICPEALFPYTLPNWLSLDIHFLFYYRRLEKQNNLFFFLFSMETAREGQSSLELT